MLVEFLFKNEAMMRRIVRVVVDYLVFECFPAAHWVTGAGAVRNRAVQPGVIGHVDGYGSARAVAIVSADECIGLGDRNDVVLELYGASGPIPEGKGEFCQRALERLPHPSPFQ